MLRVAMYVAAVFIGAILAFLGIIVVLSALKSGELTLVYGGNTGTKTDVISRAADESRFWQLLILVGGIPAIGGLIATRWGWRKLNNR